MSNDRICRINPNKPKELSEEDYELLKITVPSKGANYRQFGPKRFVYGKWYEKYSHEIYNLPVTKDDIWIVTLPRSGTTLTEEIVWLICNDLDYERALKIPLVERFPFLEFPLMRPAKEKLLQEHAGNVEKCASINTIFTPEWEKKEVCSPRFIKTHLPLSLIPPELTTCGSKVVYVARNPKDQILSWYNFFNMMNGAVAGDFEKFLEASQRGLTCGSHFEHIKEAWDLRNSPDLLFLFYEDIVMNPNESIRKIAKFFGKQMTDIQVEKLANHIKVENFKNNPSVNRDYADYFPREDTQNFVRKGKVGSWKSELYTPELIQKADRWIEEEYKKTDLRFPIVAISNRRKCKMNPNKSKELSEADYQLLKIAAPSRADVIRQFGPKKFAFGKWYEEYSQDIYNLPVTKDDIWIVTLPRSGTTLTEELIWLINNDLDYERALKIPLVERIPFLDDKSTTMSNDRKCKMNPNKSKELSEADYQELKIAAPTRADATRQFGPKKFAYGQWYEQYGDQIYNLPVTKDDIWIVTLPRSGTTLTEELMWLINNDLDYETAKKIPLVERIPFLEYPLMRPFKDKLLEEHAGDAKKCASINTIFTPEWEKKEVRLPRFIKTHLPLSMIPPELTTCGSKVVYVARNPKDQILSWYNFVRMMYGAVGDDFEQFWEASRKGLTCGPHFEHIKEGWELRNNPNLLFLFYEDIVMKPHESIRKIANFFNKEITDAQVEKLANHIKVENFKNNPSVNSDYLEYFPRKDNHNFVRKGKVGSWKTELYTPELIQRADRWIEEEYKKTDLRFPIHIIRVLFIDFMYKVIQFTAFTTSTCLSFSECLEVTMENQICDRVNPNKIIRLTGDDYKLAKTVVPGRVDNFVQIGPKKFLDDDWYEKYSQQIYNLKVTKDDIWIVTIPRSGTTLTEELVWLICNNLDYETALKIPLVERVPFLEFPVYGNHKEKLLEENKGNPAKCASINIVFTPEWEKTEIPKPRFIKTHLALSLIPPELTTCGSKVVYVARNPKDQAVSRYNFYKMHNTTITENFEQFWEATEKGLLPSCPYFEHIKEAWELRDSDNLLFLFYEDIVMKPNESIKKIAKFFNKPITESQVEILADHIKVENFKRNPSVSRDYADYFSRNDDGNFVRKGKVGSWKTELFTPELIQRADRWIEAEYKKTDLRFPL
ncbi:uncharacterized protein LOC109597463 [Aethina tumida]|uniref:uncharacterized protein LOC109597463 n=1 Tax=Aethina tumida TaxID=116153 RepID=UPI0021479EB7|nr:uncharacterized protein LOC109597463 [Aethina tumida]